MSRFSSLCLLLMFPVIVASCQESTDSTDTSSDYAATFVSDSLRGEFPYRLSNPVRSYELPAQLVECSGLAWLNDTTLLIVQDEIGVVFWLNLRDGQVGRHIRFAGTGDFEEVVVANDELWVLRSDAKLYQFSTEPGDDAEDDKWYPSIPEAGDYEAMTYLPDQGLLITAKEPVMVQGQDRDRERAIFLIPTEAPESWSVFQVLDLREVEAYLQTYAIEEHLEPLLESFDAKKKRSFKPSAMAVHPQSGNIYILASVGHILLVLNPDGQLLHVRALPEDLYPQPEGMTFAPDGTLYIAHEGVNDQARVHVLRPENIH